MEKFNFENLNVYQESLVFTNTIYEETRKWPRDEMLGLSNQLRRAAVSIALNIAEGTSRTRKDFRHFLDLSRGSVFECVAVLTIALNRRYIDDQSYQEYYNLCNKLARMISKLKSSISETRPTTNKQLITK